MPALLTATVAPNLSQAQFDTLSTMLEKLMGLILPLHQLLEAQEGLDNTITERLESIMQSFGTIAASLQTTAEALAQTLDQETSVSSMAEALQKMELRLQQQALGITSVDRSLKQLIDWLGVPLPREVGRNS
jgi:AcrR family transcriptional regulator